MKKRFLLLMLFVALLAPWAVKGQNTVYQKVTQLSDITSDGTYILVNEANKKVTLTTGATTSSGNYLSTSTITITDNQIDASSLPANTAYLTISGSSTYTLKNQNDKYICGTISSGNCKLYWGTNDSHYNWNISFSNSEVSIRRTVGNSTNYLTYSYSNIVGSTTYTSGSVSLFKATEATDYPAPKNLTVTSKTAHEATLTWASQSENLTGYAYK